jgi:hypothetical protein
MTDNWDQQGVVDDSEAFMASSLPACKFESIGTIHGGTISAIRKRDDIDPAGNIKRWPNGDIKAVYVIDLDGEKCIYARGNLYKVIRDAINKAGIHPRGAHIEVRYSSNGTPTNPGFQPPKLFECRVLRPGEQPDPNRQPTPVKAAPPATTSQQAAAGPRPW